MQQIQTFKFLELIVTRRCRVFLRHSVVIVTVEHNVPLNTL